MFEPFIEYLANLTSKDSVFGQILLALLLETVIGISVIVVLMFLHIIALSIWALVFIKDCFIKAPKPPVLSDAETLHHKKTK